MYLLFPGGSRRKREVDDESNFFESDFGDDWFNDNDSFFGTEEEETTTQTSAQLKKKIGDDDTLLAVLRLRERFQHSVEDTVDIEFNTIVDNIVQSLQELHISATLLKQSIQKLGIFYGIIF